MHDLPDIVTTTESIIQTRGTWYAILDIANTIFAIPLTPEDQDQFPYIFSFPQQYLLTCHLSPVSGSEFSMSASTL